MSEEQFKMLTEIKQVPAVLKKLLDVETPHMKTIATQIKQYNPAFAVLSGRGSSDNACVYGQYVLELLADLPCSLSTGSIYTLYKNPPHIANALVLGVSQSGETDDVCETIRLANKEGSITMAVTNNPESTLFKLTGDNAVYMQAGKEESVCATKSFTASLAAFLMLANELSDKKIDTSAIIDVTQHVIEQEQQIASLASHYTFASNLVVLGTGLSYSAALETALKLKESCYISAWGMSSVDFLHGPVAIASNMFPIIVLAPNDETLPVSLNVINRVKQVGAHVLVISDSEDALKLGDIAFTLPHMENYLYPFSEVTFAQLFAFHLARLRNINPDAPRYLSKVTQV